VELTTLLDRTIDLLQSLFDNIRITSRNTHYHFTGLSGAKTVDSLIAFIEEAYNEFIADNDDDEFQEFYN
jgi:hypothetical protein